MRTPFKMAWRSVALVSVVALLATGQARGEEEDPRATALAGVEFFRARPFLADLSRWHTAVDHAGPRPSRENLGETGVGNGRAFALLSLALPLNTLHGICGPAYDRGAGFFSDLTTTWTAGGRAPAPRREHSFQVRGAAVTITWEQFAQPALDAYTITFAPWTSMGDWLAPGAPPPGAAQPPGGTRAEILRFLLVRNRDPGAAVEQVEALLTSAGEPGSLTPAEAGFIQTRGTRAMLVDGGAPRGANALRVVFGDLPPAGEAFRVVRLRFREGGAPWPEPPAGGDAGTLRELRQTVRSWRAWSATGAAVVSGDPRWDDFIEGMKVTVKVQQARTGASCPMSRYTGTWTRDLTGPAFFLSRMGHWRDARAMLDYAWHAACAAGGLRNMFDATLAFDPAAPPPAPDWTKAALGGRTAAEGPSYVPLQYERYVRWSGDRSILDGRRAFLEHCVMRQRVDERGLLPFSGDETFREMLKIDFNLPASVKVEERYWSSNSAILFLQAAEALCRLFPDHYSPRPGGPSPDLAARHALVRAALDRHYRANDGTFAALLDKKTLAPDPRPFEDVEFGWWWSAVDLPEPRPAALDALVRRLQQPEGTLVTVPETPPSLPLLGKAAKARRGVYTGMGPGLALGALNRMGHPAAARLFEAIPGLCSPSGNLSEAHYTATGAAVHPVYDRVGAGVELSARLRCWEGAIVADACVEHLTGLTALPGGALLWRPRGPPDVADGRGLRLGDAELRVGDMVIGDPRAEDEPSAAYLVCLAGEAVVEVASWPDHPVARLSAPHKGAARLADSPTGLPRFRFSAGGGLIVTFRAPEEVPRRAPDPRGDGREAPPGTGEDF
ncbi:MAG: hypothetical protein HY719_01205 [Planctomycetes bacterium]|nr:hypothetical protein [Planctomycetota bacterium]